MGEFKTYTASGIFTGETWLNNHAIVTGDGYIKEILPLSEMAADQPIRHFDDGFIAPAFIDLQIYGAGGKLFAVYPEAETLSIMREHCRRGGSSHCLPTVATNKKEVFYRCIDAVRDYWKQGADGILGLHLEGPWINSEKRGAHIESLIHAPTKEEVQEIISYGKEVIRMITLAPEICSKEIIQLIREASIVISAGHSNARYDEAKKGFSQGISAVTHLFNAMSPLQHRAPGLVGAAMDDDSVMASIIADGNHVEFPAIRIAKQVMRERLFAITDAVTTTSRGYYQHELAGDKYEAAGILSGSSLTMAKAVQNLVNEVGIEKGEALRMASLYPAKLLKLDHEIGRIEKGYKSKMIVLDEKMELREFL